LSAQFILVLISIRPHPIRMPYRTRPVRICGIPVAFPRVLTLSDTYGIIPFASKFLDSSAVEQPAVNRWVAGSNPARGATGP
jgi:hypothetical protein